jgi:hypothetical protein
MARLGEAWKPAAGSVGVLSGRRFRTWKVRLLSWRRRVWERLGSPRLVVWGVLSGRRVPHLEGASTFVAAARLGEAWSSGW